MNLNKKLLIILTAIIFVSCSSNNDIQIINSENVKIEELKKEFNRVIGSGALQGKGKSNFSSGFIFESSENNSFIVFKDFQSSITSGQFAAWYIGEELIGSGVIN